MRFKIFETKVTVSFLFMTMICILLLTDRTGFILPMLFAVLIHETGHLFLMWLFGCAPSEINLIPASVRITASAQREKGPNILILFFGPFLNIIIFLVIFLNYKVFGEERFLVFALVNLIYGVFNLLPFKGLDGGSILEELISPLGRKNTVRIMGSITLTAGMVFLAFAIILAFRGNTNYSAFIMALYLLITVVVKF